MEEKGFKVDESWIGKRLDKFLAGQHEQFSRSYLQSLIEEEQVLVNGEPARNSYRLKQGDTVQLRIPEPREMELSPADIELDIIYEDSDIVVINKQAGLVVHPAPGHYENTLVNALLAHTDQLSGINGVKRPGIVHRLDKETSGALVVAKNDQSHRSLVRQFKKRQIEKIYRAIIKGNLEYDRGKIDAPIGRSPRQRKKMAVTPANSKKAVSHFQVLDRFQDYTYVEIRLETGRTHQIRVHFAYLGHPVIGDEKYGRESKALGADRQLLHAYRLGLFHPASEEWMEFEAPIPADFTQALELLAGHAYRNG